ncbi:LrgB family protein [Leuconostoc sp. MS02]|uniref:LrgB family protein n=1 Tax=Leuconostoc aquikimchii TaxID=3236804 RepID=A0ABV3S2S4_9LACO
MLSFLSTPFWGIFLTIAVYWIGQQLFKKYPIFIFQPLFIGMVLGILILIGLSSLLQQPVTSLYQQYKVGGDFIFWFLSPATMAFAVPLYKRRDLVKQYWLRIFTSLFVGLTIALFLIFTISRLFGLSKIATIAMLPQAATTAIALPISSVIAGGGQMGTTAASITAMAVIVNAVVIYALGSQLIKWFKLDKDPIGLGLSFGTAGHTIGSAKAIEVGEVEGAMASISMVVIGLIVDLIVPTFAKLMGLM